MRNKDLPGCQEWQTQIDIEEGIMDKCPSCSAEIRTEMKFCPHCGTKIVNTQAPDTKSGPQVEPSDVHSSSEDSEKAGARASKPEAATEGSLGEEPSNQVTGDRNTKIISIGALLLVIGLATVGITSQISGVGDANERQKLANRADIVAGGCAQILGDHVSDIGKVEVLSHNSGSERVRVNILDSKNARIGEPAECEYSVNGNILRVETIKWERTIDGVKTDISYDRGTNIVSFEREQPQLQEAQSESSLTCEASFRLAASVPLSRDNNDEIRDTTWSCDNVAEWWSMLQRYPDAFGVTYFLESEKDLYVGSACLVGGGSPVCRDGDRLGLTF